MNVLLERILEQVQEAEDDLRAYPPAAVDWYGRARAAVSVLVPCLAANATSLKSYVERILNAPARLHESWDRIRESVDLPEEIVAEFEATMSDAHLLNEYVSGDIASAVVMRHLQALYPGSDLRANGKSDYPDLWLRTNDYTALPRRSRKVKTYGAARVGKPPRPVRVPDGLEVKTCRDSLKVDCHYNHAGLHLAVVFTERVDHFQVVDVALAFLKGDDYRRCGRNTAATTDKFSFNGERFISLLTSAGVAVNG